jgi:copper chaperone CopZ
MKKIFLVVMVLAMATGLHAQFDRATLQASGLTCAMCTRAIDNALKQIPFVASVKPDIKNSAFDIVFKKDMPADIDVLKKAVEDAGFFVARLTISGSFQQAAVKNDGHITLNGKVFHFIHIKDQVLNGEQELTVVDKDFLTAKEFKKFSGATTMKCILTGKAGSCCSDMGVPVGTRIYHVTI